jgi:hypothetical protein
VNSWSIGRREGGGGAILRTTLAAVFKGGQISGKINIFNETISFSSGKKVLNFWAIHKEIQ